MERVLITGGKGDLAQVIGDTFSDAGLEVIAPGRDELDVANPESVRSFFSQQNAFDLLIANAGLADNALIAKCSSDDWDRQLEANLHGAFRCAKAVSKAMLSKRRGHIIFISSYSALHPPVGQTAYASAKAGLIGLAKSLALELGAANVRTNTILPGFLETRMTQGLSRERLESVHRDHALGRINTAEAVAKFIVHLHCDMPHTSGQVFQLDSRVS